MIEELFLNSTASAPRLRIGVILDGFNLLPPGPDVLSQIRRSNFAEVVLVVLDVDVESRGAERRTRASDTVRDSHFLFNWYRRWDHDRIAKESAILERRDCRALVDDVPLVHLPREADDDAARIADYCLDVLIHFGSSPLSGAILDAARCGVWSLHWGDESFAGNPPHFWEMVDRRPLTGVSLRILSEPPCAERILASVQTRTESNASLARNTLAPSSASKTLVIQKLHELHQRGWKHVQHRTRSSNPTEVDRAAPNHAILKFFGTQFMRQARLRLELANTIEHWQVAMRWTPDGRLPRARTDALGYRGIDAPREHYYADPFVFTERGRRYLFVEDFSYIEDKGSICCLEILADGSLGPPESVIKQPYHCSYPQIIRDRGEIFMLPETGFNETVEIYAAVDFPHTWRLEKVLYRGSAFDTTVVEHDGLYWFFATLIDKVELYCPQLFLFYSDSLMGDWTLHPESPISRDIRTARCGGSVIRDGNTLIRVAQDGSVTYGRGLRFMEIVKMNTREYEEREVAALANDALGSIGVHTYNRCDGIEVIDIKRRRSHAHLLSETR